MPVRGHGLHVRSGQADGGIRRRPTHRGRVAADAQSGSAQLPTDKLLTDKRDLTFALAGPASNLLKNPQARVTVYTLTIVGGR
jgi:hypothetical protein